MLKSDNYKLFNESSLLVFFGFNGNEIHIQKLRNNYGDNKKFFVIEIRNIVLRKEFLRIMKLHSRLKISVALFSYH